MHTSTLSAHRGRWKESKKILYYEFLIFDSWERIGDRANDAGYLPAAIEKTGTSFVRTEAGRL